MKNLITILCLCSFLFSVGDRITYTKYDLQNSITDIIGWSREGRWESRENNIISIDNYNFSKIEIYNIKDKPKFLLLIFHINNDKFGLLIEKNIKLNMKSLYTSIYSLKIGGESDVDVSRIEFNYPIIDLSVTSKEDYLYDCFEKKEYGNSFNNLFLYYYIDKDKIQFLFINHIKLGKRNSGGRNGIKEAIENSLRYTSNQRINEIYHSNLIGSDQLLFDYYLQYYGTTNSDDPKRDCKIVDGKKEYSIYCSVQGNGNKDEHDYILNNNMDIIMKEKYFESPLNEFKKIFLID